MRCNWHPYPEEEIPDLNFTFSPLAPVHEQVANLIFRFSEYKKMHKHMGDCLATISDAHYKSCDTETLLKLKQPIQVLLYAREALMKIEEAIQKDMDFCQDFLIKLQCEGK